MKKVALIAIAVMAFAGASAYAAAPEAVASVATACCEFIAACCGQGGKDCCP
jgi:hypothetical protein